MKKSGTLLLLFSVVIFVLGIRTVLLLVASGNEEPGSVLQENLVLDAREYDKTSEVVVIPKNGNSVINASDDGYWNSIVSESTVEQWRGVFIQNRKITLGSYAMAQYPVTQELYTNVMGRNPSYFSKETVHEKHPFIDNDENPDLRPVETVSWFDAVVFCNLLTMQIMKKSDCVYYTGSDCSEVYTLEDVKRRVVPFFNKRKKGYRLPTEAEWEFAARGGNTKTGDWFFAFSGTPSENNQRVHDTRNYLFTDSNLNEYGWYRGNSNGITHEVGTKLPNALGLYDMSGGVWEWLYDWYDNTVYTGTFKNPAGAQTGTDRVLRGGSWYEPAFECSVTRRFHNAHPYIPHFYFGFRYCRSL